jgi:acetyl coenzyme A synthetase (ADP forming)-like protein
VEPAAKPVPVVDSPSRSESALDFLFRPRAVAVIGASRHRGTVGGELFHNLVSRGYPGAIYPVNRKADSVQSVRAYRRLADLPERVDLAVLAVPHQQISEAVDECALNGVKALVVISAGFAEVGAEGARIQREITDKVRRAGMRMVGPNCLGVINTEDGAELNATFAPAWPPAGNVAFSSQSGALGLAVLDFARTMGIGISQFISVGNRADLSSNDVIEHWETDPRTRVILLYLEGFGNPRRFMEIARRVSRTKPIVAVKSGRTAAGARAAGSHTGALATADVAVDALLGQAGVIRTDTIEQLFDVAGLLANQPFPKDNRVAIVTNAGGPGIMAADACEVSGLALAALSEPTLRELRACLPAEASLRNPVDMIASASVEAYERVVRLLLDDPAVDAVLALYVPLLMTKPIDVAAAIRRAAEGATKPVLTCLLGTEGLEQAWDLLRAAHLPAYHFPENAVFALARAVRHGRWLARPTGKYATFTSPPRESIEALLASEKGAGNRNEDRWLSPDAVSGLLRAYGIRTPRQQVVSGEDEAVAAAAAFGSAVALKLVSDTITHKSDVGGVVLHLRTPADVSAGYRAMMDRLAALGRRSEVRGVLVQEMIGDNGAKGASPGSTGDLPVETFVGLTEDQSFGKLIAFGLGGTRLELSRDVAFRVNPISDVDAAEMLADLRGAALLTGFRGSAGVDRKAIVDILLRLSRLAEDCPQIRELDINPLVALPPGQGAIAVDTRVRVRG